MTSRDLHLINDKLLRCLLIAFGSRFVLFLVFPTVSCGKNVADA